MTKTDELTFEEWVESTQHRRDELDAYGRSPLPADVSERHQDIENAIRNCDDISRIKADAESLLSQAKAQAMFAAMRNHPDFTAKEREIVIKDSIRGLQRLVDGISVTHQTIKSRIFASLNANRAGLV